MKQNNEVFNEIRLNHLNIGYTVEQLIDIFSNYNWLKSRRFIHFLVKNDCLEKKGKFYIFPNSPVYKDKINKESLLES